MLICMGTGFASGLPLYLLIQLLPAWLRLEGISLTAIGFFTMVTYPYTLKFLWSPFLERYALPMLGRRRGWMMAMQLGLIVSIASLGFFSPQQALWMVTVVAVVIAIFSATQDIALDAYRREILDTEGELAMGNTIHVQAYRISGLVPGSLGLLLVDVVSWQTNFFIMAAFMGVGVILTLVIKEPKSAAVPQSMREAIVLPFKEFFTRRSVGSALAVLGFIFFYKLGDNMATALATPFYLDLGFLPGEIGLVAKNAALWPAIIGGILGAIAIVKIGINRALWVFGGVQLLTIFGFVWLSITGADLRVLAAVIAAEYLGVGLGTAASVAFIARETSRLAAATQFALLTALASLPRVLASSFSGLIVDNIGWTDFFYWSAALALPGMVLLYWIAPWNANSTAAE
ncbi:MAG: PAT family beta-lactamase induction signal transducer AmpG [Candidatus Azotimanducaceae bacterium]|jgi:PAT family beta-lactamase induction signal transducer AmpG